MLKKVEAKYRFKKKRNFSLITPCCNRSNKDGKFASIEGFPDSYGYCFSCGKTTLPPSIYENNKGERFIWNKNLDRFEKLLPGYINNQDIKPKKDVLVSKQIKKSNYIPEAVVWDYYSINPENNLLKYLRKFYGNERVDLVKEMYVIGTCNDGGTIFWNINKNLQVQKAKISFYNNHGKRTNRFKVPYKNDDGFYSCLFGEHLVIDKFKGRQKIILVESEKTAIVGDICMPKYTWLAYGGSNGLTQEKLSSLVGHKVLIVPDISRTATEIMYDKLPVLTKMGIDAKIWDMTEGKSDENLKKEGIYNKDLEDFLRDFEHRYNPY